MSKRVLLVENKFGDRLVLKDHLSTVGCTIIGEAKDVDESMEKYEKLKPDMVVVGAVVPDIDGVAVVSRLIRMDGDAKILICVTRGQQSLALQALAAGAKDFIVKPINDRQLRRAVDSLSRQPDKLRFEGYDA